ncbi:hypothetical protein ANN_26468 [Periplaneta americana]|uniref:Uncharacterized protein n=1 Tax=Periplaneta americana TaxID=6978 RepID=A0ABQ8RYB3_PERAM|nr:hypothetical protein ANN_26468 [Periplaneta americana]
MVHTAISVDGICDDLVFAEMRSRIRHKLPNIRLTVKKTWGKPEPGVVNWDCMKHVPMQRCHIAQWHDGLKRSGKALLHRYQREGNDFLGRIIAMDETWTRSYEPILKHQSKECKHPGSSRTKKVRPTQSAVKEMFIVAYGIDGESHRCCCQGSLAPLAREILEHPPYSPDMSPCDYDLFTKVKEPLRGTRYNTRDELIRAIGRSIRNINKDRRADGVRRLPNIWKKVRVMSKITIINMMDLLVYKADDQRFPNRIDPAILELKQQCAGGHRFCGSQDVATQFRRAKNEKCQERQYAIRRVMCACLARFCRSL